MNMNMDSYIFERLKRFKIEINETKPVAEFIGTVFFSFLEKNIKLNKFFYERVNYLEKLKEDINLISIIKDLHTLINRLIVVLKTEDYVNNIQDKIGINPFKKRNKENDTDIPYNKFLKMMKSEDYYYKYGEHKGFQGNNELTPFSLHTFDFRNQYAQIYSFFLTILSQISKNNKHQYEVIEDQSFKLLSKYQKLTNSIETILHIKPKELYFGDFCYVNYIFEFYQPKNDGEYSFNFNYKKLVTDSIFHNESKIKSSFTNVCDEMLLYLASTKKIQDTQPNVVKDKKELMFNKKNGYIEINGKHVCDFNLSTPEYYFLDILYKNLDEPVSYDDIRKYVFEKTASQSKYSDTMKEICHKWKSSIKKKFPDIDKYLISKKTNNQKLGYILISQI